MYKLASIDLQTKQAIFSDRDFSGGVFNPVSVNRTVYYRANFFSGDGVLRFPETIPSLSGVQTNVRFIEVNAEDYRLIASELCTRDNNNLPVFETRPYFAIRYMNPFNFWLPLPLVRSDDSSLSIDGGGLFTVIMDPTNRHLILTMLYADLAYRMAMVDLFSWQNTVPGFPVTLEFSDRVETNTRDDPYRFTRASLWASFFHIPGRWAYSLSLGTTYIRVAEYDGGENTAVHGTAYNWEETRSSLSYFAGISFSNIRRQQHELFGTGISLNIRGSNVFGTVHRGTFEPRFDAMFQAVAETRFPLRFLVYGAYSSRGMNIHGVSRTYGLPIFNNDTPIEYPHPRDLIISWIGGGDISLGLFSFEIQNHLSHVYFNRVFCTLSLRSLIYDSQNHPDAEGIAIGDLRLAQSLVLRLGLLSSVIPIKYVPLFIEPNIWGTWKFSNTITGQGDPWSFGIGVNLRI